MRVRASNCCGAPPMLRRVGDDKQWWACVCEKCGKTPVTMFDGRVTEKGAYRIWNKRVLEAVKCEEVQE